MGNEFPLILSFLSGNMTHAMAFLQNYPFRFWTPARPAALFPRLKTSPDVYHFFSWACPLLDIVSQLFPRALLCLPARIRLLYFFSLAWRIETSIFLNHLPAFRRLIFLPFLVSEARPAALALYLHLQESVIFLLFLDPCLFPPVLKGWSSPSVPLPGTGSSPFNAALHSLVFFFFVFPCGRGFLGNVLFWTSWLGLLAILDPFFYSEPIVFSAL